ncbi:MAG TPA: ABC transporter substrate-binding protein [Archaeoglobaceae archaeon]|nr:ABC transporter substrate-binding protein [Archaeoglobaceae archaeon]
MLTVAHTPDADDAFMFYAMTSGRIPFKVKHIIEDIESLNRRAFNAELDVTALSAHAYALLHNKYRILSAGASVGDGYGPIVVAESDTELHGKKIAVPGKYTTANLLLKLASKDMKIEFEPYETKFDRIIDAVKNASVDAGLLIHEGQITYEQHDLVKVLDLWEWWYEKTSLPLPLGINVIKRDIPEELQKEFLRMMKESIRYALENQDEAINYAMKYSRGQEKELIKKFALMYVNEYTYEMNSRVVEALNRLYNMAESHGFFKKPPLDILF